MVTLPNTALVPLQSKGVDEAMRVSELMRARAATESHKAIIWRILNKAMVLRAAGWPSRGDINIAGKCRWLFEAHLLI